METWKKERLAQLREHIDTEAAKRAAIHRAKAGAAVAHMQNRGETLSAIATRTETGVAVVRAMLRFAPESEQPASSGRSHAPDGGSARHGAGPLGSTHAGTVDLRTGEATARYP